MRFTLDKQSGVPLYRQLAAQVRGAIETGVYHEGERLPTEAELFRTTGLSKGTIKAAYEQLRQMGYIRKVQGSGAYVQRPAGEELKTRAAQLSAQLFGELSLLPDISVSQGYALFREELHKAFARTKDVRAALVICAPELITSTSRRLNEVEHFSVTPYLLGDILNGSTLIDEEYDFLLTTQSNSADLIRYTAAMKLNMEKMELTEGSEPVAQVTKVASDTPIGVIYRSTSFYGNICDTLKVLGINNSLISAQEQEAAEVFSELDWGNLALIVPPDYEKNSNQSTADLAQAVEAAGGRVIPFQYVVDRGSLLHLETLVQQLYEEKNRVEHPDI